MQSKPGPDQGRATRRTKAGQTSPAGQGAENPIGEQLRLFAEKWHLILLTTTSLLPPTFFGTNHKSHIDHILVPQSLYLGNLAKSPQVHLTLGRRLQLIRTKALRDHVPVSFRLSRRNLVCKNAPSEVKLDRMKLAQCVVEGTRRDDFFDTLQKLS